MVSPRTQSALHTRTVRGADQVSLSQPGRSVKTSSCTLRPTTWIPPPTLPHFALLFVDFVGAKDAGEGDQALVAVLLSVHDNPWPSIC
jgi:hypothetical protein